MLFKKKKPQIDEKELDCPRDGKKMNKRVIGDVIIDECPKCHGLWLDDQEIDKLIEHAQKIGLQEEIEKKMTQQEKNENKAVKKSVKKKSKKKKE